MLSVNEISIFAVDVEEVLKHAEDKSWDGENLGEGTETELAGESYEERDSQQGKEYPPFFTPGGHEDGQQNRNACQ